MKAMQEKLGLGADGICVPQRGAAVKEFQRSKGLEGDGIVGAKTVSMLGVSLEEYLTTDTQDRVVTTAEGLSIHNDYLDKDECKIGPTNQFYVSLHHTVGGHGPHAMISNWNNDTRGSIKT